MAANLVNCTQYQTKKRNPIYLWLQDRSVVSNRGTELVSREFVLQSPEGRVVNHKDPKPNYLGLNFQSLREAAKEKKSFFKARQLRGGGRLGH